ncbi:hypothetical protein QBC37DRAFT_79701 [Rhypophila decipiens]|uniref:Kinesin light chain n=1 Tax=Rhypophila decipiens TaxID=261697 RepID=A0AAN7B4Y1_9PEZI|nr:hypothetical protein QBC37DRAFT_79701 [Rhypophila decipiens]
MADPFSIVAGAAGLADLCLRTVNIIRKIHNEAGHIDGHLGSLVKEMQGMENLCYLIESELTRDGQDDDEVADGKMGNPRGQMKGRLNATREIVEKLYNIVRKISGQSSLPSSGKLEVYRRTIKTLLHESDLSNCRALLAAHQDSMHLLLTIITSRNLNELSDNLQSKAQKIHLQLADLQESKQSAATLDAMQGLREALNSVSAAMDMVSSNQHFHTPQSVSSLFTGREAELRELGNYFLPKRDHSTRETGQGQRRFVVYGLGGSGKTQFCSKFAYDNQDRFWGVFWIDASTPERITQTLGTIAEIAKREKTESAALDWLSTLPNRWLLIIDNADDPDVPLERYFPKGNRGNILVTTRNPAFKVHGNVGPRFYDFGGLESKDAIQLLLKASEEPVPWDEARQELAETINKRLGSLALAIIHAGAAIRDRLCSLKDYLSYYRRMLNRIRSQGIRLNKRTDVAIFTTWEICYERLEQRKTNAAIDARQLLNVFAFFHRENISPAILKRAMINAEREAAAEKIQESESADTSSPKKRLSWGIQSRQIRVAMLGYLFKNRSPPALPHVVRDGRRPGGADDAGDRIQEALKELIAMSLITYHDDNDTISMHPIVHTWARERPQMTLADQALWADVAGNVLAASVLLPSIPGLTSEDERYNVGLLPHVEHVDVSRKAIANQLSKKWDAERTIFSRLAALVPNIIPDTDKMRMSAKFAVVYGVNGKWHNAEELLRSVSAFLNQYLGRQHKRSREVSRLLSSMYWHMGRLDDAARVQNELVQICRTHLGPFHPDTLRAVGELGRVYQHQGKYTDARQLQEAVLDNMKKLLPDNHEYTVDLMDRLGSTQHKFWDFEKAYRLHSAAARGMEKRHGPTHARTLEAKENMCRAVVMLGNEALEAAPDLIKEVLTVRKQALKIMQEVHDKRKADLGKENPYTLLAKVNLAIVMGAAGRLHDAEELVREGLPVAERNLGHDHLGTMLGRQVLAGIWLEQGRHEEAEELLLKVSESQKKIPSPRGDFHPDRLGSLIQLARCCFMLGKIERAIEVCDETIRGFESIDAGKHPLAVRLRTARMRMWDLVECKSPVYYEEDRRPERHDVVFPCILFAND